MQALRNLRAMPARRPSSASAAAQGERRRPWTDVENDLTVADYFAMLDKQLRGKAFSKAEHNRNLRQLLPAPARSRAAIEYKHRNISFALHRLGLPWLVGYLPAQNIQSRLVEAVLRQLPARGELAERLVLETETQTLAVPSRATPARSDPVIDLHDPPTPAAPAGARRRDLLTHRIDWAIRDERNRRLGRQGEERVLASERARLAAADRDDLARKVRWVSAEDGDGAGYDIRSYCSHGEERLLEVKTTTGDPRTPFHLSANERECAAENPKHFRIVRVYDFLRRPAMFRLRPPLEDAVRLEPDAYLATPY